jgi:hypothetical protein
VNDPLSRHPTASTTRVEATLVRTRILQAEIVELTPMTTTERDALAATVNGMMIYNSTAAKFQGYQAGSWQNLI